MAGQGPPPKDPSTRRRRNADPNPPTKVTADGMLRGPDLPELPDGKTWHPMTCRWWSTWRLSPQAASFAATDWDVLLETALLHHVYWGGDLKVAAELRLRVAQFGATPSDRLRLRMSIETPKPKAAPAPAGNVTEIASRRSRLSG